jgi:hypothetical protein
MKSVPWTTLQEMKGDTSGLKKIEDAEELLKSPEGPYLHLNPSARASVILVPGCQITCRPPYREINFRVCLLRS